MDHFRRFAIAALMLFMGMGAGHAAGTPGKTVAGHSAAQMLKVQPADCAGCHKDKKVLPDGHVATKGMAYKDCQACHEASGQPGSLRTHIPLGHLHALNGIRCAQCHDNLKAPQPVPFWKCVACHGPTKDLAARTANVQPHNPHESRHHGGPTRTATSATTST